MNAPWRGSLTARPALSSLASGRWDVLVIGGGITGAGVFREAARAGCRAVLLERGDFASGTSSMSSKLVHGGLHYLARLELRLAREAIRERARLLRERPGLVRPLPFGVATFPGQGGPAPWKVRSVVAAYRRMAGAAEPDRLAAASGDLAGLLPPEAFPIVVCDEAVTDDARLVLRVIQEGVEAGGTALSYVRVASIARDGAGEVIGAVACCRETGSSVLVRARVVVNATGPWADTVRSGDPGPPRIRRIRGSHLVIPRNRLPLRCAVAAVRPHTGDPVIFVPWGRVVLVGGTAEEHAGDPLEPPKISPEEVLLLLTDLHRVFPAARLGVGDVQATFSGVRPITDLTVLDPTRASRSDRIWREGAFVTVAGGKLTTFRASARRVLDRCRDRLPALGPWAPEGSNGSGGGPDRLAARYGREGARTIARWRRDETPDRGLGQDTLGRAAEPLELRWAATHEAVRHLDDLLLRRFRCGLTLPGGGLEQLDRVRAATDEPLGWDDTRWQAEVERYREIVEGTFRLPALLRAPRRPRPEPSRGGGLRRPVARAAP